MKSILKLTFVLGGINQINADLGCEIWPRGWPKVHHDTSCNRSTQNAKLNAPTGNPHALNSYMNMPEEKTWVCPLENEVGVGVFVSGRPTKWIVYNHASTPIVLDSLNDGGLDFAGAEDDSKMMKSAVYPHGPVVLPGDFAVVNGYQGQVFEAREYKEDYNLMLSPSENEHVNSFKDALPRTASFNGKHPTRVYNMKVQHVLGTPGRVLMRHRMGVIHVKNEYGAICPETFGGVSSLSHRDRKEPFDMNPDCNFLRKEFVNKVGCPIDLYFAPLKTDPDANCEFYSGHMGSYDQFVKSGETNIFMFDSPVAIQRTYTSHSFVARTSHDQSLVARIEIDHDTVYDCPEPRRSAVGVDVKGEGIVVQSIPVVLSNATAVLSECSAPKLLVQRNNVTVSKEDYYTPLAYNMTAKNIYNGAVSGFFQHAT